MGDNFELVTAFSREGPKKVYVQHRLKEHAKQINELLEQKAYFYVCGDAAHMAREVNAVLIQIIAGERGIPEAKAEEIVKQMRAANQYQVRLRSFCCLIEQNQSLTRLNRRTCGHEQPIGQGCIGAGSEQIEGVKRGLCRLQSGGTLGWLFRVLLPFGSHHFDNSRFDRVFSLILMK
jgi:hypothetical protein